MRKSVAKTAALLLALLLLAAAGSVFAAAEDVAYGDWIAVDGAAVAAEFWACLLYTSPSPRDCS